MTPHVGSLPDGARGFDCNGRLSAATAAAAAQAGYRFAVRYVRRGPPHDYDLQLGEVAAILGAGLGLMVVQHVAEEGWDPTRGLGHKYGAIAALETEGLGILKGVSVWCDLEGVDPAADPADVIAYANAWYDEVNAAGYLPGLYVGWHAGLTAGQLFRNLKFSRYWAAYNLNREDEPAVRGVCMRQFAAHREGDLIPGFTNQTMDVDVIHADLKGGTPALLLP